MEPAQLVGTTVMRRIGWEERQDTEHSTGDTASEDVGDDDRDSVIDVVIDEEEKREAKEDKDCGGGARDR